MLAPRTRFASRIVRAALTSTFAIGVIVACACDKGFKAGGPCPPEVPTLSGICIDDSSFLLCDANRRLAAQPIACKGPKGCSASLPGKLKDVCDISGNQKGDFCVVGGTTKGCNSTDRACSPDKSSLVVCGCGKDPRMEVMPCRGPKGCFVDDAGLAECDNDIAVAGEFCDLTVQEQTLFTCASDKRTMLGCSPQHEWKVARTCRGPKACSVRGVGKSTAVECDSTVAEAGDPCELEGLGTCTVDRKSSLVCKRLKFGEVGECMHPCESVDVGNAYNVSCEIAGDGGAPAPPPSVLPVPRHRAKDGGK